MRTHRQSRQRPKKNLLIAGEAAVLQALDEGTEIERIFLQKNIKHSSVKRRAAELNVPVNSVPEEKLRGFNIPDHGGVIALRSKVTYRDLQDVISWVVERGEVPLFLMLDGITDIRNIGGIARTAYCCGVHALIIPHKGVGALGEDAIVTSSGALERLNVCRVRNLEEAIRILKLNGIRVMASEMTAKEKIFDQDLTIPTAFIVGSEDQGISQALYQESDVVFQIPMMNDFESLNVSAATAIILYESMRQRLKTLKS